MTESFKERLKKYREGTADETEKQFVEEKLAEFSLLQELFFEQEAEDFSFTEEIDPKHLKKNYNKKFFILGLKIFISLLIVLSAVFFIARPLVEKLYYNPQTTSAGSNYSEHQIMQEIYVQLTNPYQRLASSRIEKEGFAKYRVHNSYEPTFTKKELAFDWPEESYLLQKDSINADDNEGYFTGLPPLRKMVDKNGPDEQTVQKNSAALKKQVITVSQEMPKNSQLFVVASFNESLTITELFKLFASKDDARTQSKWLSVEVEAPIAEDAVLPTLGLPAAIGGPFSFANRDYNIELNKKYPELYPYSFLYSRSFDSETVYEQQFLSLLQYTIDHYESDVKYLPRSYDKFIFEDAKKYVEKNGFKVNALYFTATPELLSEFAEKSAIWHLEILDMNLYTIQ